MFGWLVDFVRGVGNAVFQGFKWIVNTILGLPDDILTLLGVMPWKKLRVQAVILVDEHRNPIADREKVQDALDLAADVFAKEAKVHLRFESHVFLLADIPPKNVLNPGCDGSIWGAQFTSVGSWFRGNQWPSPAGSIFGYGAPVTVFIVNDVTGEYNGCTAPPFLADYSVVEAGTLDPGSAPAVGGIPPKTPEEILAARLTLAHEIGHACNLFHAGGSDTLMNASDSAHRKPVLARWQKALFRGSPHVTYL